jgi:hypothetical protein
LVLGGKEEEKFHEHFYIGINDLKLPKLASVKQGHDESLSLIMLKDSNILKTNVLI